MRYFLLDQVTEIEVGKRARGIKCVTYTDETLHDHFPDFPILPGAMIVEGMAQLGGFLLECTFNKDGKDGVRRAVLAQIEKMKFYNTSGPGDRLEYTAEVDSMLEDAAQVTVEATCAGEKRARGRITFAMIKIDSARVTDQRMQVYKVWTRTLKECPPLV